MKYSVDGWIDFHRGGEGVVFTTLRDKRLISFSFEGRFSSIYFLGEGGEGARCNADDRDNDGKYLRGNIWLSNI